MKIDSMIVAFWLAVTCASLTHARDNPAAPTCSDAVTCANCTADATSSSSCYWSLTKQACEVDYGRTGNLTVFRAADCPRTAATFDGRTYRLSVTNDKVGLTSHLARVGVNCSRGRLLALPERPAVVNARADGTGGEIVCAGYPLLPGSPVVLSSAVGSFYVTFGPDRVMLRTDDREEFYATDLYDRECGGDGVEYCVGFLRKDSEKRFYTQWCPRDGQCVDWMVNVTGPTASDRDYSKAKLVETGRNTWRLTDVADAELVRVEPSHAMWDVQETQVQVQLWGHAALSKNTTFTVTMADHECRDAFQVGKNTTVCDVQGPMEHRVRRGAVRFDYGPLEATLLVDGERRAAARTRAAVEFGRRFKVIGSDEKRCDPRPLPVGPERLRGIASGGHLFPVQFSGLECVDTSDTPEFVLYYEGGHRQGHRVHSICLSNLDGSLACLAPSAVYNDNDVSLMPDLLRANRRALIDGNPEPLGRFRCAFLLRDLRDNSMLVPCAPGDRYTMYPDPLFRNFTVTEGGMKIVVHGEKLSRRFTAVDVRVRLASGTPGNCSPFRIAENRFECTVQPALFQHVREDLKQIWVDVGFMKVATVNRTVG